MQSRNLGPVMAGLAMVALVGCAKQPEAAAPAAASASQVEPLPVSLNAIMVSVVDNASDALFDVGNALRNDQPEKTPQTEDAWRAVEYSAYQMVVSGRIMQIPGTGPKDQEWTADPRWKPFADSLTSIGAQMLAKAQAKDPSGFVELGDALIDACEGCHQVFKPDIPTMRIMHKPTH